MIEFEFDSTPETDAMLKLLCIKDWFVFCKDCKYWAYDNFNDEGEISDSWCSRDGANFMSMSADDFCSRGEKND